MVRSPDRSTNEGIRIQEEILAADPETWAKSTASPIVVCKVEKHWSATAFSANRIDPLQKALAGYKKVSEQDKENLMNRHRVANTQRFLADAQFQTGGKSEGGRKLRAGARCLRKS